MARDKDGRPIPVERPDPANPQARMTSEQEQFRLAAQKSDAALQQIEDLSRRVVVLETEGHDRLNAHLADHGRRFDEMMLERLREFERRFDLMADAARTRPPAPTPEPTSPP
jgi:hypothetical protein